MSDCYALAKSECVADGDNALTHLQCVRISKSRCFDLALCVSGDLVKRYGDHRQICLGIGTLDGCVRSALIRECNRKSLGIADYVVVCDDQELRVILSDDDAGTAARNLVSLGLAKPAVALVDLSIRDGYN